MLQSQSLSSRSELEDIQRQIRHLENEKKVKGELAESEIRRQRADIEKLTKENRRYKQELLEVRAAYSNVQNTQMSDKMVNMNKKLDTIISQLELETQKKKELDSKGKCLQQQISILREKVGQIGGANAAKELVALLQKQIKVLESRLEKSLQRHNNITAINKSLREKIESIRKEKNVYDLRYKKLERELDEKKKAIGVSIETANKYYSERESALLDLNKLKEISNEEYNDFEKEWRNLTQLIDEDRRIYSSLKSRRDVLGESNGSGERKGELQRERLQTESRHENHRSDVLNGNNAILQSMREKISAYEESFAKIQVATGIVDFDELIKVFVSSEEKNFSLFAYANELVRNVEAMELQIASLKEEASNLLHTDIVTNQSKSVLTWKQEKMLREMNDIQMTLDKKNSMVSLQVDTIKSLVRSINDSVTKLASKTGFAIQDKTNPSADNFPLQFAMIERRITEMMTKLNIPRVDESLRNVNLASPKAGTSSRGNSPSKGKTLNGFKLPSTFDVFDDEADEANANEVRPFMRDEIKHKVLVSLEKTLRTGRGVVRKNQN